jgi:hypothetical protein
MLVVTDPAISHRLTTPEAVRMELSLRDWSDREQLEALIDQASAAVRTWCNRTFALEGVRETLRLPIRIWPLMLTRWPVVSIASITEDGTALGLSD